MRNNFNTIKIYDISYSEGKFEISYSILTEKKVMEFRWSEELSFSMVFLRWNTQKRLGLAAENIHLSM